MNPYDTPALAPPPGVVPNFTTRPGSIRPYVIATLAVCMSVSTLVVVPSLFAKAFIAKKVRAEGYLCALAYLACVAFLSLGIKSLPYGGGAHQWDMSIAELVQLTKLESAALIIYTVQLGLVKTSILLQLMHIFVPNQRTSLGYLLKGFLAINIMFYIASFWSQVFECVPREKLWNPSISGTCIDLASWLQSTAFINLVSDILIVAFPLYKVWTLQLPSKQKIGVFALFSVGVLACLASVMRLTTTFQMEDQLDEIFYAYKNALWGAAEQTCGLLVCAMPGLPLLYKRKERKVSKASIVRITPGDDRQRLTATDGRVDPTLEVKPSSTQDRHPRVFVASAHKDTYELHARNDEYHSYV